MSVKLTGSWFTYSIKKHVVFS